MYAFQSLKKGFFPLPLHFVCAMFRLIWVWNSTCLSQCNRLHVWYGHIRITGQAINSWVPWCSMACLNVPEDVKALWAVSQLSTNSGITKLRSLVYPSVLSSWNSVCCASHIVIHMLSSPSVSRQSRREYPLMPCKASCCRVQKCTSTQSQCTHPYLQQLCWFIFDVRLLWHIHEIT
jgi:hypothetical protein